MQFFKKNFEKVALALFIMAVVVIGVLLWRGVDRLETEIASQGSVSLKPTGKNLDALDSGAFDALSRLREPHVEWGIADDGATGSFVKPLGFIWCADEDCWHWIPANTSVCPFCASPQGDDQQRVTMTDEDSDGDGIPDVYEAKYEFLDPANPFDASEDADDDFFSNYAEYRAGTDPSDPGSHPPLVGRLFLVGIQRDPFNARLQKVTAIEGRPKEEWDIQVDVFRDGGKRTQFTGLGKSISVDGVDYEIVEVEKVAEERFDASVNATVTMDRSFIVLKSAEGDPLRLVSGEAAYDKEDTVRFVLALDPTDRRRWRVYSVSSDENLKLVDTAGNAETYSIKIQNPSLVILTSVDVEDGPSYPITRLSNSRLQKLVNSQRPASVQSMPGDAMMRPSFPMEFVPPLPPRN